jgi:hypothetical protein
MHYMLQDGEAKTMPERSRAGKGTRHELDRRHALMSGSQREQRTANRFFAAFAVTIHADGVRHVGLLRDFCAKGLFVYSDFRPACGAALGFTLRLPRNTAKRVAVECRGKVVRVESATSGAAIGIAVEIDEYELRKTTAPIENAIY